MFKVGDTVRVNAPNTFAHGRVGVVKSHDKLADLMPFEVEFNDKCAYFEPDELELVTATPAPAPTVDLAELIRSTRDLYARFGVEPTPAITRRVFMEEAAELHEASTQTELGTGYHVLSEAVDVFVTTLGILMAHGRLDEAMLNKAIAAVVAKNDAKQHDRYEVNSAGKIARKPEAQ